MGSENPRNAPWIGAALITTIALCLGVVWWGLIIMFVFSLGCCSYCLDEGKQTTQTDELSRKRAEKELL